MIEVKPVFVEKTKNVRNLCVMMDGLALGRGEGRLGMVYSRAGRGKTRTTQWYHAHNGGVFLRMQTIWRTSELEFLKALCRELGIMSPPGRKGPAFMSIVETLISDPKPVFLDEVEKLPRYFLDVIRDLSDLSTAPIVLIGEEELVSYMKINRRVWSRTYQSLEFLPISKPDIVAYIREASGLSVDSQVAGVFHAASGGDFRIVRRGLLSLAQIANAKQTDQITVDMAQVAVKTGLRA
ncbi:MAG: ATP-binding protein [Deltaproteobacteria bacterium]|nr:ATP-binding protein [Deltaproteobacteria bacterium]